MRNLLKPLLIATLLLTTASPLAACATAPAPQGRHARADDGRHERREVRREVRRTEERRERTHIRCRTHAQTGDRVCWNADTEEEPPR